MMAGWDGVVGAGSFSMLPTVLVEATGYMVLSEG